MKSIQQYITYKATNSNCKQNYSDLSRPSKSIFAVMAGVMLAALILPGIALAQGNAQLLASASETQVSRQAASSMDYRLGAGDVLHVSVWKNDDLSRTVTIRPDGKISLPLIGELAVEGLTPTEVQDLLVNHLAEYVDSPARNVFVIVEEVNSYQVSVLGEVNTPGRFKIQGQTMVLDALSVAGGFTPFAATTRIIIFRRDGNGIMQIPYNYKDVVAGKRAEELFFVQPGDVILVP
jgi:polysaccharide export outer membrane protein